MSLRDSVEQVIQDAERYRWLRAHAYKVSPNGADFRIDFSPDESDDGDKMDKLIDQMRQRNGT